MPTTLLALLKAVATGWQEARLAEHALEIGHDAIEEPRAIDLTTRRFNNPTLLEPGINLRG